MLLQLGPLPGWGDRHGQEGTEQGLEPRAHRLCEFPTVVSETEPIGFPPVRMVEQLCPAVAEVQDWSHT